MWGKIGSLQNAPRHFPLGMLLTHVIPQGISRVDPLSALRTGLLKALKVSLYVPPDPRLILMGPAARTAFPLIGHHILAHRARD